MSSELLNLLPFALFVIVMLVFLRQRMRAGQEANQKLQDRMQEQLELGQRNERLLREQVAELKRIADALERRGGG